LGVKLDRCYSSEYEHAKQTAGYYTNNLGSEHYLQELNSGTEPRDFLSAFASKIAAGEIQNPDKSSLAFVGHEPLLGQIVAAVTGRRVRPLGHLDAVCVNAPTFVDLRLGCGEVKWRFPVRAYEESNLRQKVTSKLTAATFLAGFSFSALLGILLHDNSEIEGVVKFPLEITFGRDETLFVASLLLVLATVLFVGAVYVYDRLSMPEGFWATSRAGPWRRITCFGASQRNEYGELYTLMVDAWTFFFTPAVVLAAAGILLIALAVGTAWSAGTYLLMTVLGVLYYRRLRPRLGVD